MSAAVAMNTESPDAMGIMGKYYASKIGELREVCAVVRWGHDGMMTISDPFAKDAADLTYYSCLFHL